MVYAHHCVCNPVGMRTPPAEWPEPVRLRAAMHAAGQTVAGMAAALDVSPNTVSRWLNGHCRPSRSDVLAWSLLTGTPADDLRPATALPRLDSNQQPSDLQFHGRAVA